MGKEGGKLHGGLPSQAVSKHNLGGKWLGAGRHNLLWGSKFIELGELLPDFTVLCSIFKCTR